MDVEVSPSRIMDNNYSFLSHNMQSQEGNPVTLRGELQHRGGQLGACDYPHTCPAPVTLGNTPIKESGPRAGTVCGGDSNYI